MQNITGDISMNVVLVCYYYYYGMRRSSSSSGGGRRVGLPVHSSSACCHDNLLSFLLHFPLSPLILQRLCLCPSLPRWRVAVVAGIIIIITITPAAAAAVVIIIQNIKTSRWRRSSSADRQTAAQYQKEMRKKNESKTAVEDKSRDTRG